MAKTTERTMPRIVVADDDLATREALVAVLRGEGYEADAVADGAEAIAAISKAPPDLLVLDLMMPSADGVTVLGWMTLRGLRDRVPVLVLTAAVPPPDDLAGVPVLTKPVTGEVLLAEVKRLLPQEGK